MSFVKITSFDNYIPANLALQRLQEEGINCYLENETTVTLGPFLSNLIGGIGLMVHELQQERAREILGLKEGDESID